MEVLVRDLAGLTEWTAASALYRSVFGYASPEYGVSPRLLAALQENSGTAIGAFAADGELVGFCYGFSAIDDGELYHYSQAAVVAASAQGSGVGRLLKRAQAAAARAVGATSMRWTFDPYALRNAHFNFSVLGAAGVRFLPDYYDDGDSDRVLVSWRLDGLPPHISDMSEIVSPAVGGFAAPDPGDRDRLRRAMIEKLAEGGHLTAVTQDKNQATYTFTWEPR